MSRELHRFRAMDVDVVVHGADTRQVAAVERLLAEWDRVFSRFRPHSELALVNASRAPVVAVSPLFARALRSALDAADATGGLVDPTLGAALGAAGYDRDFARWSRMPGLSGRPRRADGAGCGSRGGCSCGRRACGST